eukprot:CCRYP_005407-RB/>CCRYP_005407-RB protein AED:0.31 eAED:0.31 QI:300/1/1/1/1/1/4/241/1227
MGLLVFLLQASTHFSGGNFVRSRLRGNHPRLHPMLSIARDNEHPPERRIQSSIRIGMSSSFVDECSSFLLSPDSITDGIVSQNEYASFLLSQCRFEGLCGDETSLEFEQLDLVLQLKFVSGVCPYFGSEERISCIDDLESMWLGGGEFGFRVSENRIDSVRKHVEDMCMDTYADVVEMRFTGTFGPTSNPSTIEINESSVGPSYQPSNAQSTISSLLPSTEVSAISNSTSPSPVPIADDSKATQIPVARAGLTEPPTPSRSLPTPLPSFTKETQATHAPASFATGGPSMSFVHECTHYLLSPDSVRDGIVSQIEFAEFLTYRCVEEGLCNNESNLTFQELDVSLQLEFILGACQDDSPSGKANCIDELHTDWRSGSHFGFDVNNAKIELLVEKLCSSAFDYAILMGLVTTSEPTSAKPTNAPTMMSQIMPPSLQPNETIRSPLSGSDLNDIDDDSADLTGKKSLRPKRALVGLSAACAVFLIAAGSVLAYRRSDLNLKQRIPDDYYSKDANHYGTSTHEQWARSPAFPFSHISSSCSSSSSSFRDYRFVPVFGPDGQSIVQFDPNTAGAVVIGSVTIGGSSSISTGPFVNDQKSPSKSYISIGQVSLSKQMVKSGTNSGDSSELSSLSSGRSAQIWPEQRRNKLFASSQKIPTTTYSINSTSKSTDKSDLSTSTVPLAHAKSANFKRRLVRFDNQVSFADWKAASFMISEYRSPDSVTDSAAAKRQKQFFFDVFTTPISEDSDASGDHASVHSLSTNPRLGVSDFSQLLIPSKKCDINVDEQWVNAVSPHLAPIINESAEKHVTPADEALIPWRKGGFSSSYQPSDSKKSGGSACSSQSTCIEQWESCHRTPSNKNVALFIRPVRCFRQSVKSIIKGWFKRKKYQTLNGRLHEDPSVISMQSYSSNIQLLPAPYTPLFGLPNLILGTWAAATIPVEPKHNVDAESKFGSDDINKPVELRVSLNSTTLGIAKRDIIESCSSDFESSTGWTSSSYKHSSSVSSCSANTSHRDIDSSLVACSTQTDKPTSAEDELSAHALNHMHTIETLSEEDSSDRVKTKEIKSDTKAENNINVNIVSDSSASGSFHTDDICTEMNAADSHRDDSNMNTVYHETINLNGINSTRNAPGDSSRHFVMILSRDIRAETSSTGDNISSTDNDDWSYQVSQSSSTPDSDDTDDSAFNAQSLSLSLGSGSDSASQAIEWAINREVSKQMSSILNDSIVSALIEE